MDIGRDQTRRLMAKAGIQGARRAKRVRTTRRKDGAARHPDLVGGSSVPTSRTGCG
jgi:putative transposase